MAPFFRKKRLAIDGIFYQSARRPAQSNAKHRHSVEVSRVSPFLLELRTLVPACGFALPCLCEGRFTCRQGLSRAIWLVPQRMLTNFGLRGNNI